MEKERKGKGGEGLFESLVGAVQLTDGREVADVQSKTHGKENSRVAG